MNDGQQFFISNTSLSYPHFRVIYALYTIYEVFYLSILDLDYFILRHFQYLYEHDINKLIERTHVIKVLWITLISYLAHEYKYYAASWNFFLEFSA